MTEENTILLQLPASVDTTRAKAMLLAPARLEFKLLVEEDKFRSLLGRLDESLDLQTAVEEGFPPGGFKDLMDSSLDRGKRQHRTLSIELYISIST